MAYFSNSTDGDILTSQCDTCLHGLNDEMLCPVAAVQINYNYTQCGNADLEEALNFLVDADGICWMKLALGKAGITIDLSERDQLPLDGL